MKDNTKGMLIMLLCPTIWSLSGLIAKIVPWPGMYIAGWRGLLSGFTIYVYMRLAHIKPVLSRRTWGIALSVTGTLLLYFAALKRIPAANAVALQYTEPVFLLFLSAAFLKKRYKKADYLVVAIALVGVAMLFLSGGSAQLGGSVLALLSGLCYAITYFCMTDCPDAERLSGLLFGNTFAFVGVFTADPRTLPIDGMILTTMLLGGLFQIAVPHILMTKAMKLTTPLACSLIATLEMVLNPIWVYIFTRETPGPLAIVGCAVIFISVLVWCVHTAKGEAAAEGAAGQAA